MNNFTQFLTLKGLQPVTVLGHVKGAERILKQIGTPKPNHEQAKDFIFGLYQSSWSYSHKVNSATALEYYMEFMGNPIKFGRQRKPRRLLKETLSEAEIIRMVSKTKNTREKALLVLLSYAGLRPKEICEVKVHHINFGLNTLLVEQGKGLRDNFVHLPAKCVEILMKYVSESDPQPQDWLFETYQGNKYNPQALRKFVKTIAKRAEVEKRVYPYVFRHSLATNMIKRGSDVLSVKEHFRHAWIETTMHYIHSLGQQERAEQHFPQYI